MEKVAYGKEILFLHEQNLKFVLKLDSWFEIVTKPHKSWGGGVGWGGVNVNISPNTW